MSKIFNQAEYLFLFFAIIFGVVLVFILPPLGGNGDEYYHFQRIIAISNGHILNEQDLVPRGIIEFIKEGISFFNAHLQPFGFSWSEWHKMADIKLDAEYLETSYPNIITYHNPFAYLPQVIVAKLCFWFELSPLVLFYLARLAGLFTSVFLTFIAIKKIPSHKYALCALALLPSVAVLRSNLIADTMTNGFAFLFIAYALREISGVGLIKTKTIIKLAIIGGFLVQCKIVYVCLLFLVLAIPKKRFSSNLYRLFAVFAIIIPSIVISLIYMIIIKKTSFLGASYHTWGGEANPDAQIAFILHQPLQYVVVFLRTVFTTFSVPIAVFEIFINVTTFYLPPFAVVIIMYLLVLAISADVSGSNVIKYGKLGWLVSTMIIAFTGLIATMLYIHWNGVAEPVIKGLMGRYFIPFLPLLLLFFPKFDKPILAVKPQTWIIILAVFGFAISVWRIGEVYYG